MDEFILGFVCGMAAVGLPLLWLALRRITKSVDRLLGHLQEAVRRFGGSSDG